MYAVARMHEARRRRRRCVKEVVEKKLLPIALHCSSTIIIRDDECISYTYIYHA